MTDMEATSQLPLAHAHIVSSIPGRLRLRLSARAQGRGALAAAASSLAGHGDLLVVQARPQSVSLVVGYDAARSAEAWARLGELGLHVPSWSHVTPSTVVAPSARVIAALGGLDELVARRASGHDLRTLVPIGLGMLSVRQLMRGKQRLAHAPWYVLAWYASETFQKHHQRSGEGNG